jgi:transcriptional regulator with XRE-family HTH domain
MSELTERLRIEFRDEETRHIYADDFLNTYIASQLKVLREDREWTQRFLAERTGMRQERISVLEDVNYEAWSVKTLIRLAKAFDLRLSIKFESFGSFLTDFEEFNREALKRPSFEQDPAFTPNVANVEPHREEHFAKLLQPQSTTNTLTSYQEFLRRRGQPEAPNEPSNPLARAAGGR